LDIHFFAVYIVQPESRNGSPPPSIVVDIPPYISSMPFLAVGYMQAYMQNFEKKR
jgi:hypothetical protein